MAAEIETQELWAVTAQQEPVFDLTPLQGMWTEAQYLKITDHSSRLLELTDGAIEVLPMPTRKHQAILRSLFLAFDSFLQPLGGIVLFAVLRLRISAGRFREPDLLLLLDAGDPRGQDDYWLGADLVAEVVSPDNPRRDTVAKRVDYAEAAIPEYWIVNPLDETITVLRLADGAYAEYGTFRRGDTASSALLGGFTLDVSSIFDVK